MISKKLKMFFLFIIIVSKTIIAQNNITDTCLYEINRTETDKMKITYSQYFKKTGLNDNFYISKC